MIAMLTRRRNQTPIGLDIGAASVRAVQLTRVGQQAGFVGDTFTVTRAVRSDRPPSWLSQPPPDEGSPAGGDSVARHVRVCMSQAEFRGRAAVIALDLPDIEYHSLELPNASAEELRQIVRVEVERLASGRQAGAASPDGEIEAGHWFFPAPPITGPNALGVAVPRDLVLRTLQACVDGNVVCTRVDAAATALCRFVGLLRPWNPDSVWGILDLGYRQTRVVLCVDDVPLLVRTVGTGGDAWTRRIAESLEISVKTAEIHKREHGIARVSSERTADQKPAAPGRAAGADTAQTQLGSLLLGILRCDLNDLAAQVQRSYEYALNCYSGRHAADLVLVGGGAAMPRLAQHLSDALAIPVRPAASYLEEKSCRLRYASARQNRLEEFALAIGLAIEG